MLAIELTQDQVNLAKTLPTRLEQEDFEAIRRLISQYFLDKVFHHYDLTLSDNNLTDAEFQKLPPNE